MTRPGSGHPPGGATSHHPSSARFVLAAGLLALGIGDVAVIDLVLLPRTFGSPSSTRPTVILRPQIPPLPAPQGEDAERSEAGEGPPIAAAPPAPAPLPATRGEGAERCEAGEGPGEGPPAAEQFPDLLFARNTTWLSPESRETLDRVADALKEDPARGVALHGHTDNVGPPDLNRSLSRARARRASLYLRAHGVEPARIDIQGFGSDRPVEGEPTPAARARNRRVEIAVH
jgi:outer membrane protein OmpA-like peptidoglycan-associated protein